MLFAKIIPFHRTKSGSISRAQKYRIKWKSAMKFVEKVTKALIKQQNFSNYYNKTDKIRSNLW